MKIEKSTTAQACSCCTSVVCMAQMGTVAAAGGASMGAMGAAASASVPLLTRIFQTIGLGFLLSLPAILYQGLLLAVLAFTGLASYLFFRVHRKPWVFGLAVVSSVLLYSSIYVFVSEPVYWLSFGLMVVSAVASFRVGARERKSRMAAMNTTRKNRSEDGGGPAHAKTRS